MEAYRGKNFYLPEQTLQKYYQYCLIFMLHLQESVPIIIFVKKKKITKVLSNINMFEPLVKALNYRNKDKASILIKLIKKIN
jgi:hypothetical protein